MKFLIQKIDGEIRHDFSFTLLESIRFKNWLTHKDDIKVKYLNTSSKLEKVEDFLPLFKQMHFLYVPVGSVEFVSAFLKRFYGLMPKPINIPEELIDNKWIYTRRCVFNGTHRDIKDLLGKWFVKSNDTIKGFKEFFTCDADNINTIPEGNYQYSKQITIDSEWRCFVYDGKLVGLQNYCGEFTQFPNVSLIKKMIGAYKSAPIAYTLDIGTDGNSTFVIEAHDFFSCGLYGFNDVKYPTMLHKWFWQYVQREMVAQREKLLL